MLGGLCLAISTRIQITSHQALFPYTLPSRSVSSHYDQSYCYINMTNKPETDNLRFRQFYGRHSSFKSTSEVMIAVWKLLNRQPRGFCANNTAGSIGRNRLSSLRHTHHFMSSSWTVGSACVNSVLSFSRTVDFSSMHCCFAPDSLTRLLVMEDDVLRQ